MEKVCMYLRLSREDGEDKESNSIQNQRDLIQSYANSHDLKVIEEFVDDGISGTTFDRPAFNDMLQKVQEQKINTIIVKDLSRFGRDYIQAGRYLQQIFPAMNVRFISVNDNYDSAAADVSNTHLILPIKNFINDSYCRDISMKIRSAQKVKRDKGQYIGAFAPFGYKKDPNDRYHLIVDQEVKPIIVEIFNLKIMGHSSKSIANMFNERGVITPLKRKQEIHGTYTTGFGVKKKQWDCKMIIRILSNRVYTGCLEQGKQRKVSYKSKELKDVKKEDWSVTKNAHERIISDMIFELANKMLKRDTKTCCKEPSIFAGMLFCKDCQSSMVKRHYPVKDGVMSTYICGGYNRGHDCTRHTIREEELKEVVKTVINDQLALNQAVLDKLENVNFDEFEYQVDVTNLEIEKQSFNDMRHSIRDDLKDGLISQEEFNEYRKLYRDKVKEIDREIESKKMYVENIKENVAKIKERIEFVQTNGAIKELSRILVISLIDRIEIGENKDIKVICNNTSEIKMITKLLEEREQRGGQSNGSN